MRKKRAHQQLCVSNVLQDAAETVSTISSVGETHVSQSDTMTKPEKPAKASVKKKTHRVLRKLR